MINFLQLLAVFFVIFIIGFRLAALHELPKAGRGANRWVFCSLFGSGAFLIAASFGGAIANSLSIGLVSFLTVLILSYSLFDDFFTE